MAIVFSAIVPHTPLLIPSIGKDNLAKLKNTQKGYEKIAELLLASDAESIFIISPHGPMHHESFVMNLNPRFKINFQEFGDLSTTKELSGDIGLAYKIRERLETKAPLQLISVEELDHGSSVPLFLLTDKNPRLKVMPIYYSGLSLKSHFEFGTMLQRELLYNNEKIAVIASADLSHALSKDAPAGYSPRAKKFDKKLIEYLQKGKNEDILKMDPKLISDAKECGLKSIVMLMGILNNLKHEPQLMSYEAPFGVGYLNMNFLL